MPQQAKRRAKKLTKEQKKAVWAPIESNAGAGWGQDPRRYHGISYDSSGHLRGDAVRIEPVKDQDK